MIKIIAILLTILTVSNPLLATNPQTSNTSLPEVNRANYETYFDIALGVIITSFVVSWFLEYDPNTVGDNIEIALAPDGLGASVGYGVEL